MGKQGLFSLTKLQKINLGRVQDKSILLAGYRLVEDFSHFHSEVKDVLFAVWGSCVVATGR